MCEEERPTWSQTRHPPETSGCRLCADITLSVCPAETEGGELCLSPWQSLLTVAQADERWSRTHLQGPSNSDTSNWIQLIGKLPIPAVECWLVSEGCGADADRVANEPRGYSRNRGSPACGKQQRAVPAETEWRQKTWIMFIDVTAPCCAASGLTTRPMCDYSLSSAGIPFNQLSYVVTKYVKSPENWRNMSSDKFNQQRLMLCARLGGHYGGRSVCGCKFRPLGNWSGRFISVDYGATVQIWPCLCFISIKAKNTFHDNLHTRKIFCLLSFRIDKIVLN